MRQNLYEAHHPAPPGRLALTPPLGKNHIGVNPSQSPPSPSQSPPSPSHSPLRPSQSLPSPSQSLPSPSQSPSSPPNPVQGLPNPSQSPPTPVQACPILLRALSKPFREANQTEASGWPIGPKQQLSSLMPWVGSTETGEHLLDSLRTAP